MSETCGRCKRPLWSGEGWPEATFCRFSAGMREECYRVALDAAERHISVYREAWQALHAAATARRDVWTSETLAALDAALALDPEKAAAGGEEKTDA